MRKGIGECRAITLTAGVDVPVGTSGDDTFVGIVDFGGARSVGALSTLTANDQITGGAGTDTLRIDVQNAGSGAATTAAKKVQVISADTALGTVSKPLDVTIGGVVYSTANLASTVAAADTQTKLIALINGVLAGKAVATATGASGAETVTVTAITAGVTFDSITKVADRDSTPVEATITTSSTSVTTNAAALAIPGATISGVENMSFNMVTAEDVSASATRWSDVTKVSANSMAGNLTIDDIGLVAAELSGTQASGKGLTITVKDTAVAGTTDAASITLNAVTSDATKAVSYDSATSGKVETINYTLTGTNKVDGLAQGAVSTTISGAGTLATNTASTLVLGAAGYIVDGSAATGALKFIADNGAMNTAAAAAAGTPAATITTGTGKDEVVLQDALASTDNMTISLGNGDDKLTIATASNDYTSTKVTISGGDGVDTLVVDGADAKAIYGSTTKTVISGFENLLITALEGSTDASKWAGYAITIDGADSGGSLINIADGSKVGLTTDLGNAIALSVKDAGAAGQTNNSLTIALTDVSDGTAKVVTVADVENITITSSEATAATGDVNTIGLVAAKAANLTISGAEAFTLVKQSNDLLALSSLDASGLTGKLTANIVNAQQGVSVKLGSGGSDLTLSAYADSVIAGAKVDAFTINVTNDGTNGTTGSSTTAYDKIASFTIGTTGDTIKIADTDGTAQAFTVASNALTGSTTNGTVTTLIKDGVVTGFTKGNGSSAVALSVGSSAEVDTLAEVVALVASDVSTNGKAVAFVYGENTYLFVQNVDADTLVELTGVTSAVKMTASSSVFTLA